MTVNITIEKQEITAKPRKLKASWSLEYEDVMAEHLKKQIDHEVVCNLLKETGWTLVPCTIEEKYSDELNTWMSENIKHKFQGDCEFSIWAFENENDANWFSLRWSSNG